MLRPHPARDVSRWVARVPVGYSVSRLHDHWAVVGPTGLFVVGSCGDDPVAAAEATRTLAQMLRTRLAEAIPWVPFVDALLVANDEVPVTPVPCTVVELASLELALRSGPVSIDEAGLAQIARLLPGVLDELGQLEIALTSRPLDPA